MENTSPWSAECNSVQVVHKSCITCLRLKTWFIFDYLAEALNKYLDWFKMTKVQITKWRLRISHKWWWLALFHPPTTKVISTAPLPRSKHGYSGTYQDFQFTGQCCLTTLLQNKKKAPAPSFPKKEKKFFSRAALFLKDFEKLNRGQLCETVDYLTTWDACVTC